MAGPRRVAGARALLFERLVDLEPGRPEMGLRRFVVHDAEGLKRSVAYELERLFSTRVAIEIESLEVRQRSTIDYGIPDLSAFPLRDPDAEQRLARHLEKAIAHYEPRLEGATVVLRRPGNPPDALVAHISGSLAVGEEVERVDFTVQVSGGEVVHGG